MAKKVLLPTTSLISLQTLCNEIAASLSALHNHSEVVEAHLWTLRMNIVNKEWCAFDQLHAEIDLYDIEEMAAKDIYIKYADAAAYVVHIGLKLEDQAPLDRTKNALNELERIKLPASKDAASLNTVQQDSPLRTRERDTLLAIIAVLCKEAKLDYSKAAKTAGLIQSTAAGMGISIGETTIENHLKKIPNALESRTK